MFTDSNLRTEVLSEFLEHPVKPLKKDGSGTTEDILSVHNFHLYNLLGKPQGLRKEFVIDVNEFFDSKYDCDFTDQSASQRGDELYECPKGWYCMALKVKGKYPDGDSWLGRKGAMSPTSDGEWPISYHKACLDLASGTITSYYSPKDVREHERGTYSTPDIHFAEKQVYYKHFTSKTTGKTFRAMLQNRINPEKRVICPRSNYWLIPVAKGVSAEEEKKIVEHCIRPYGILIQLVDDVDDDVDDVNDESMYIVKRII